MAPRTPLLRTIARLLLAVLALASVLVIPAPPLVPPAEAAGTFSASPDGKLIGPDGRPFFMLGFNYEGPLDRAWKMWDADKWDPNRINADLARASAAGMNSVRAFVQAPLAAEISAGNFSKLDTFFDLAAKNNIAVLLTLADYGEDDLTKLSETAKKIAARYKDRPGLIGYDLKNEPKYANLVLAKYPAGVTPPLLGNSLIATYGERVPHSGVQAWRDGEGKGLSPSRFSDDDVYRTANNYKLYREFLGDASVWVTARDSASSMDYLDSPDSAKWRPFVDAMSGTLAAWLAPQVAAIRSVDPNRLITVGYNDPIMAKLKANETLSFLTIHRYPGTSAKSLLAYLSPLDNLRKTFPGKPVALTEFGWANDTIDPNDSALLESATWLWLWTSGHAGGLKWMLDDLPPVGNPKEDNLGMFKTDGTAKPVVAAAMALASYFGRSPEKGKLQIEPEGSGLRYTYTAKDAVFYGGRQLGDQRVSAKTQATGHVFLEWNDALSVRVTTRTDLDVNVAALTGKPLDPNATLLRGTTPITSTRSGDRIAFSAVPPMEYQVHVPVSALDARIQIVWPQGNLPVTEAAKANIGVYLFEHGGTRAACPAPAGKPELPVTLWRSINNGVEEPIAAGQKKNSKAGDLTFPSWAFNDVDVSAAKDPASKIYFRVSVDGMPTYGNVWSHGADARTIFPRSDVPVAAQGVLTQVDAKIEIVWPQGDLPVQQANKANIGVYLFNRGTLQAPGLDWKPTVRLWRAIGTDEFEPIATGVWSTQHAGELTFPIWAFNDVDVSAAKDPANKIYFRVSVDGVDSRSNVWSHAADARTIFPQPDVPTGVVNCS